MTVTHHTADAANREGGLSRRDFIKVSGGTGAAVGTLSVLGASLAPAVAHARTLRITDAKATPSVCPYCAVGCGTIVHTINGEIVNIEGNPDSPVSEGNLCPKGAATYQLAKNDQRLQKVLYRAPGGTQWEEKPLDWAMDRIAQLVKSTRDETFVERSAEGKTVMNTLGIFSLGGATNDNEWNYTHSKLMRGLGIVAIENQARI